MRRRNAVTVLGGLVVVAVMAGAGPGTTPAGGAAAVDLTNLPIGTEVTTTPQAGAVYSCQTSFNGGGAHASGDWIHDDGTYDLTALNGPVQVGGGPEGILYVPPGSSLIPDYQYVLISEYSNGEVALFQLDVDGNPIPATRQPFMTGLSGAEGACTDPVTGDLVFSTFGGVFR